VEAVRKKLQLEGHREKREDRENETEGPGESNRTCSARWPGFARVDPLQRACNRVTPLSQSENYLRKVREGMERPMGLEPTPGPWQGPVLPLYYGRPNQRNFNTSAFLRQEPRGVEREVWRLMRDLLTHAHQDPSCVRSASSGSPSTAVSANLQHPCSLHDGRLSLPLREFGGFFPVRIHASKPLPVLVKHSHLPVLVLSPPIFPKLGAFSCGFCFGHDLNISTAIRARKY
jgi:hypothetical protein